MQALAYVIERSPYEGAAFSVHLMIADAVNDMHGNVFWMPMRELATKARCGKSTAARVVDQLITDEFLSVIQEPRQVPGGAGQYRFLTPDVPLVWSFSVPPRDSLSVPPRDRKLSTGPELSHHGTESEKAVPSQQEGTRAPAPGKSNPRILNPTRTREGRTDPKMPGARLPVITDEYRRAIEAIPTTPQATPRRVPSKPPQLAALKAQLRGSMEGVNE